MSLLWAGAKQNVFDTANTKASVPMQLITHLRNAVAQQQSSLTPENNYKTFSVSHYFKAVSNTGTLKNQLDSWSTTIDILNLLVSIPTCYRCIFQHFHKTGRTYYYYYLRCRSRLHIHHHLQWIPEYLQFLVSLTIQLIICHSIRACQILLSWNWVSKYSSPRKATCSHLPFHHHWQ